MTIYLLGLFLSALAIYLCALWVHKASIGNKDNE